MERENMLGIKFKTVEKKQAENALEQRLDTISELTRGLGKAEFNNLIEAVKSVYEARQKLLKVKTDDEKEVADIEEIEKHFNLENLQD
jgi:hypothetical protein